jgi:ATP-dependent protease ClpP protease subunit
MYSDVWHCPDPRQWTINQIRAELGLPPEVKARSVLPAPRRAVPLDQRPRRAKAARIIEQGTRAMYGPPPIPRTPWVRITGFIGEYQDRAPRVLMSDVEAMLARYYRPREIAVFIDSHGGIGQEAEKIVALLRGTGARLSARCGRMIASSAIDVLLACDWREARGDTQFVIHGAASAYPPGRMTSSWHRQRAVEIEKHDRAMVARIANRCGARREYVAMLMQRGKPFDAKEALRIGLVHALIE